MNADRKYFADDAVAAWAPGSDTLAIGQRNKHWNDDDVTLHGGESAQIWRDRAVSEGALVKLDDNGFFPLEWEEQA
jgi:hypothetical protein